MSADTSAVERSSHRLLSKEVVYPLFAYLALAYLFHGIDQNILKVALAPGDGAVHGLPSKIYDAELSFWNPYILSGVSRLATQGFQTQYWPGILIMKLFPSSFGYNLNLLLHYGLSGFFTYLFARRIGLRGWSAFVSGICFMFSGFMSSHKGHHMMMNAATWLPLVLYFVERYVAEPDEIHWLFLGAASYAMSFYADYLAVPMYIAMVAAPYLAFRTLQTSPGIWQVVARRAIIRGAILLGLGMMLAAPYILPILESVSRVTREQISYEFFSSYSFPLLALPMLFIPFAFGTHTPGFFRGAYFGPWNLTEMAGYIGLTPLVFAVIAFARGRKSNKQIWFWTVVALAGFVLVLGSQTPVQRVLYYVPVYNMFRAPARNWLEVHFAIAMLAGFGVDMVAAQPNARADWARLYRICWGILGAAVAGCVVVFQVLLARLPQASVTEANVWLPWTRELDPSEFVSRVRAAWSLISPNILVPLCCVAVGALGTWAAIFWIKDNSRRWGLIALLIAADLATFGHFHDSDYGQLIEHAGPGQNTIYRWIKDHDRDLSNYRLLPFETMEPDELFPNINLPYHVATVNGYGAILLKDYAKLLGLESWGTAYRARELISGNRILSLLSTRYLATKDPAMKSFIERAATNPAGTPNYQKVIETSLGIAVYRNERALPKVRFVGAIRCVSGFSEVEAIMRSDPTFDPASLALVECGQAIDRPSDVRRGRLMSLERLSDDHGIIRAETEGESFLIWGESYYPGWQATIDGNAAPIVKVNGVLQGVLIPSPGQHRIEFRFRPASFKMGIWSVAVAVFGMCGTMAVRARSLKRRRASAPIRT